MKIKLPDPSLNAAMDRFNTASAFNTVLMHIGLKNWTGPQMELIKILEQFLKSERDALLALGINETNTYLKTK